MDKNKAYGALSPPAILREEQLKINTRGDTIEFMVISLVPANGTKCQVGEFSVLVDAPPSRKGNLILRTKAEPPFGAFGERNVIEGPGEYEIESVRVKGVALVRGAAPGVVRAAYAVDFENIRLGFLGELAALPTDEELDALGEIDILSLSADTKKIKGKELVSLVKQMTPAVVIPADEKTAKFLSDEMGQKTQALERFVVKKSDIVRQESANKLVWLKT